MIRPFVIVTTLISFLSCERASRQTELITVHSANKIDLLESDHDTLPNGKRLLDNADSGLVLYYKDVVGAKILKGGYLTCYGIDDSAKYFYLRHGDSLYLLNQGSIAESAWRLGTIEKDFPAFFITRIENGNGSPCSYQVFDKKTAKNILGDKMEADSYQILNDTLFVMYTPWENHKRGNTAILLNAKTMSREFYKLPDHLPEFCDIQIGKLSGERVTLAFESYAGDNFKSTKTYIRL